MISRLAGALLVAGLPVLGQSFDEVSRAATAARQESKPDEALALYRKALALNPSWGDGWWNLGSLLYEKAGYSEAAEAFRKLTALDPRAVPGYVFLGISEYKLKQYDAALRDLDKARELGLPNGHPVTAAARYYLAVLLNKNGLHDPAADLLLGMSDTAGASQEVMEAFGMAGLRIAKLPEEMTGRERLLALQVGKALAAAGQRRIQEALESIENLLNEHPAQPNLHYLYGTLLLEAEPDRAVGQFQQELELQPRSVPAMLALAREMERRSRFQAARAYAEKAVTADPASFQPHAILGRILVAENKPAQGLDELERARALEPSSPQIYFSLAAAYAKLGRAEDARKARVEFLRLRKLADESR